MSAHPATLDPRLSAQIVRRWPLRYAEGPDPALDRPGHVRAGSALIEVGGLLVIIQDDSNFLALYDPNTDRVRALTLPAGPGGRRQFDKGRGNKMHKLDLESAVALGEDGLLAFGSGSAPGRDRILRVRGLLSEQPAIELLDAGPLYEALAAEVSFAGSEMNIEGAVRLGERLRLFNRGNGAPRGALSPVNATADLSWRDLLRWLEDPQAPVPRLHAVQRYDLERLNDVGLTFTDATICPAGALYLAAAEDSPDAVEDGPVTGVAVGVLDAAGGRWAPLLGPDGQQLTDKAEGLCLDRDEPRRGWVVFDLDDPDTPTDMAEIRLEGPWW